MATLIQKKVRFESLFEIVKFQIIMYCFINKIQISEADCNCATYIAIDGYRKSTLQKIVDLKIFKSLQVVINSTNKLVKFGILVKTQDGKIINPELGLGIDDTVILDIKGINK